MNLIKVHNLQEYNENINKCCGSGRYIRKDATCLSWELRTKDELKDPRIREIFKSNVFICDEALELLGENVIYIGHDIGILKGVEITEEDFYWILEDHETQKETFRSCVGRIDALDPDLYRRAKGYEEIEKFNNTTHLIDFVNGAIWREQNPTPEMIQRILELAWTYREGSDQTELEYIMKNYRGK